jgi:hypothetical protein
VTIGEICQYDWLPDRLELSASTKNASATNGR